MSKRTAISELNDRNWDDEEEPEEAGVFKQASQDVLQNRTIKKAKRRVVDEGSGSKPAAFSGFSGLGAKSTQPKSDTPFSGFKKLGGESAFTGKPISFGGASSVNGNEDQKLKGQGDSKESSTYLNFLKSLNESVLAWIKQHVEENPYIILTPIFKDYEKYLDNLEAEKSAASSPLSKRDGSKDSKDSSGTNPSAKVASSPISAATTVKTETDDNGEKADTAKSKPFAFGLATTESSLTKGFSFGNTSSSSTSGGIKFTSSNPLTGFTFGQSSTVGTSGSTAAPAFGKQSFSMGSTGSTTGGFSFGAATSSQGSSNAGSSQDADAKEDEEYEPPKPEVKEIVEEDSLYSKRCKLYYQRDGQWVDRGVGNIHLKPVNDDKTQLLVRADTNLGNILLNIMLSSSMPVSRQGKNNVFLVCVPNPPINTKASSEGEETPTPMLIRVKTGEDADELYGKIEERKKLL